METKEKKYLYDVNGEPITDYYGGPINVGDKVEIAECDEPDYSGIWEVIDVEDDGLAWIRRPETNEITDVWAHRLKVVG